MAIEWSPAAEKHLPIEDAIHALRNRKIMVTGFDVAKDGSGEVVDFVSGPARDGQMMELYVHRRTPRTTFIFHAMHLRPTTWKRVQQIVKQKKEEQ